MSKEFSIRKRNATFFSLCGFSLRFFFNSEQIPPTSLFCAIQAVRGETLFGE